MEITLTKKPPDARFCTVKQLLNFDRDIGTHEAKHAARLFFSEALNHHSNLKQFLTKEVLFGNKGELLPYHVKLVAVELFASPHSESEFLSPLRDADRLGYTDEEIREIIKLALSQENNGVVVRLALGYVEPTRRRY